MNCNGNIYNIGMGCCEPMLGPVENYYTKPTIDRKLEEISSAITSGCCITPEEVDEKIAAAKTEIEAEIPTVPTDISAFNNDAGYITGVDLSDYATLEDIPTVPTNVSAFNNDAHYVTSAETANYVTSGNVETQITNHFWCGTQYEYDHLPSKQNNILYLIHE